MFEHRCAGSTSVWVDGLAGILDLMWGYCTCEIGVQRRASAVDLFRFALRMVALLLAAAAVVGLCVNFGLVHPVVAKIVAGFGGVALAFGVLLRTPLGAADFSWRSLSVGDWISVVFFPIMTVLGWNDFWEELPGGWRIFWVAFSSLVHCLLFWVVMIFFMRLLRSTRNAFGHYGSGLSEEAGKERWVFARHMVNCRRGTPEYHRYLARLAPTAQRRRRARNSTRSQWRYEKIDRVMTSYESSPSWMSATLASGGIFIWAVQNLTPGPLSASILFIPYLLIPAFEFAKSRLG